MKRRGMPVELTSTDERILKMKRYATYRQPLPPSCLLGRLLNRHVFTFLFLLALILGIDAFHDCVQSRKRAMERRRKRQHQQTDQRYLSTDSDCAGGICVGMTHGPHQGGNASYPVAWNGTAGTRLEAIMTVPDLPKEHDGITYYVWTGIFFGDESLGRMNQLVPQLVFGSALDASSGLPDYIPKWHTHTKTWMFGAHYFFEILNVTTMKDTRHTESCIRRILESLYIQFLK